MTRNNAGRIIVGVSFVAALAAMGPTTSLAQKSRRC